MEFETKKIFEWENIERENIGNIETRLETTRLDEDQMTRSVNSSKQSKKHEPKVNLDHDPSSSDSSDSLSSKSAPKRKKSKKKKKRCKHRKDDMNHPRTVIIGVNDAKIRNIRKRTRSDYAQL